MSKSDFLPIESIVQKKLAKHFPDQAPPFFVIGVSGGMDSMSLLYIFKRLEISGLVVHINYQKRGEASDKDAELVEQMAFEWGFDCQTISVDATEAKDQNFQQWARDMRYGIFRDLAKEHSAEGIAVAHHEDDQIETILQKIFRGAGLTSWTAMDVWDDTIFRPFLDISRAQIEKYVEDKAIPYRTDESNFESDFARNFLRNEWLERLTDFFPGWKQNVLRVNEQAGNYEKAIEWISYQMTSEQGIDRKAFHLLVQNVQKALILYLLKQREPGIEISHDSLQQIEDLGDLQTGKAIQLTGCFSVLRDRDHYCIVENDSDDFPPLFLQFDQLKNSPFQDNNLKLSVEQFDQPDFEKALYLDTEKISWPIKLRRWKSGDRFQPLGMEGHQQVSDHLTNRKVSAAKKDKALVIETFEEKICAVIFPPIKNQMSIGTIAEQVKCDLNTKNCLKIQHLTDASL
jgi:tRNA(Ile)-lysidine synthase